MIDLNDLQPRPSDRLVRSPDTCSRCGRSIGEQCVPLLLFPQSGDYLYAFHTCCIDAADCPCEYLPGVGYHAGAELP